jgi:hypothetical protein
MHGKIMFVVGAAVGYLIGTRQGREGLEKLKKQATDLWENPKVQRTVADAQKFAEEKIPLVGAVKDAASGSSASPSSGGTSSAGGTSGTTTGTPTTGGPATGTPTTGSPMTGSSMPGGPATGPATTSSPSSPAGSDG